MQQQSQSTRRHSICQYSYTAGNMARWPLYSHLITCRLTVQSPLCPQSVSTVQINSLAHFSRCLILSGAHTGSVSVCVCVVFCLIAICGNYHRLDRGKGSEKATDRKLLSFLLLSTTTTTSFPADSTRSFAGVNN